MSTTSNRLVSVAFTGDLGATLAFNATENIESPASVEIFSLLSGPNTITLPTGGSVPVSATIIPPTSNTTVSITLKGVSGDTGILLHPTDPMVLTFDPDNLPTDFILEVSDDLDGLRIVWA